MVQAVFLVTVVVWTGTVVAPTLAMWLEMVVPAAVATMAEKGLTVVNMMAGL